MEHKAFADLFSVKKRNPSPCSIFIHHNRHKKHVWRGSLSPVGRCFTLPPSRKTASPVRLQPCVSSVRLALFKDQPLNEQGGVGI